MRKGGWVKYFMSYTMVTEGNDTRIFIIIVSKNVNVNFNLDFNQLPLIA